MFRGVALALFSLVLLVWLPACVSTRVLAPGEYNAGGLVIAPQELELRRGKLELKFTFINRTDQVMIVDRDQMMVRLADGSVRARYKGTWTGMAKATHTIEPGVSHNVFMDFMVGDVPPGPIALVVSGVIIDGRPLQLPDYVMTVPRD